MSPNIVIIEDDPDIIEMLQRQLEKSVGARVRTFSEGQKALDHLKQAPVDLIVLDLALPDISGFELCHTMRETPNTKDTPILVVSARTSLDDKVRADEVGANRYLEKPIRVRVFLQQVEELLSLSR